MLVLSTGNLAVEIAVTHSKQRVAESPSDDKEGHMQKLIIGLLAAALFIPALAVAQEAQQDQKNTEKMQNQAAEVEDANGNSTQPEAHMMGMVSNGGSSFTSDNKTYIVNNPKSLKNYDNQTVSIRFQFDTDRNKIHILEVTPSAAPSPY